MDLDAAANDAANAKKVLVTTHLQYNSAESITPATVCPSPLDQFHVWFTEALNGGIVQEPEAVSLSTATPSGIPSARMVLFKQLDARGFVFFTNYSSRKSREIVANPNAALVFYWREVLRSVRVLGKVEKVDREESEAYFKSRPVGSRLGAWASRQSSVVDEGEVHVRLKKMEERFGVREGDESGDVPLPDFWGGWRVVPRYASIFHRGPFAESDLEHYVRSAKWNSGPGSLHVFMTVFVTFVSMAPAIPQSGRLIDWHHESPEGRVHEPTS
jgi:pyridoxamine-phosphate oxidase